MSAETQWTPLCDALEMIPHSSAIRYCEQSNGRWNVKKTGGRNRERRSTEGEKFREKSRMRD
jgi:hypothetical protein